MSDYFCNLHLLLKCRNNCEGWLTSLWILRLSPAFLKFVWGLTVIILRDAHIPACVHFRFLMGRLTMECRACFSFTFWWELVETQKKIPFTGVEELYSRFITHRQISARGACLVFGLLVPVTCSAHILPYSWPCFETITMNHLNFILHLYSTIWIRLIKSNNAVCQIIRFYY